MPEEVHSPKLTQAFCMDWISVDKASWSIAHHTQVKKASMPIIKQL